MRGGEGRGGREGKVNVCMYACMDGQACTRVALLGGWYD